MKTIQHMLNTRILNKTAIKYVRKKIRKRFEIDQFDDESINQDNKKSFNEKFNVENQLNRKYSMKVIMIMKTLKTRRKSRLLKHLRAKKHFTS